ncbi:hypothetical protein AC1031_018782 [Aphanomyces cochlioides]|nr:hypothetical protein AC1031_018782 [Aphanomyces cochlioides]
MAGPHTRRSLNQQIRRICNDAAEDYVPEKNEWKLASAQVKAIPADPNDTALREYLEFLLQNASNRWMELGQQSNPNWGLVFHLLLLVLSIGAYGLAIGIENYKLRLLADMPDGALKSGTGADASDDNPISNLELFILVNKVHVLLHQR